MEGKKILNDNKLNKVTGGLSKDDAKNLKKDTLLYLMYPEYDAPVAIVKYLGNIRDAGFLYKPEYEVIIVEVLDTARCEQNVGKRIWVERDYLSFVS